ncbi:uncharacterized protein [Anabrus simplex]|uniref:uncharacterized protein isoform X3 n=1 Tax=Anabrus simplex TaxID=316456 RepID=UPI0035A2E04B
MAVAPGLRKICEILQLLWILGSTLALVAKKSQKLVSSEEALVKEVKTLWQNARTGWDKCQSSHNVIGCRGKLVAEAETKEDKFTNKEGQLMSEAATLVNKLQSETDYCVTSELASVPAALADTFSTMEKCVKKLHVKKKAD